MSIIKNCKNLFKPTCSKCKNTFVVGRNKILKLSKLKKINEYRPEYDNYKKLCPTCWKTIRTVACDLCGNDLDVFDNKKKPLFLNLKNHNIDDEKLFSFCHICASCYADQIRSFCSRCRKPFFSSKNCFSDYSTNEEIVKWLYPYHKDYSLKWLALCPDCYTACFESCKQVRKLYDNWTTGTREDNIENYRIVRSLGRVEFKGMSCSIPDMVYYYLKIYSTQLGGNAFINFRWHKNEKHYSRNIKEDLNAKNKVVSWKDGWFTGSAMAVYVEKIYSASESSNSSEFSNKTYCTPQNSMGKIIIDGTNVLYWKSPNTIKLEISVLLTLCGELLKKGLKFYCFFDANTQYKLAEFNPGSNDLVFFKELIKAVPSCFGEVPARTRADEFILLKAKSENAAIISNDHYRDYLDDHPWLNENNRRIKGMVANNHLLIPVLNIDATIIDDYNSAINNILMNI